MDLWANRLIVWALGSGTRNWIWRKYRSNYLKSMLKWTGTHGWGLTERAVTPDLRPFQPGHCRMGGLGRRKWGACRRTDQARMSCAGKAYNNAVRTAFRQRFSHKGINDAWDTVRTGDHTVKQQTSCEQWQPLRRVAFQDSEVPPELLAQGLWKYQWSPYVVQTFRKVVPVWTPSQWDQISYQRRASCRQKRRNTVKASRSVWSSQGSTSGSLEWQGDP